MAGNGGPESADCRLLREGEREQTVDSRSRTPTTESKGKHITIKFLRRHAGNPFQRPLWKEGRGLTRSQAGGGG